MPQLTHLPLVIKVNFFTFDLDDGFKISLYEVSIAIEWIILPSTESFIHIIFRELIYISSSYRPVLFSCIIADLKL